MFKLSYNETYCDSCCDSDIFLGEFKNEAQLRKLLEDEGFYSEAIDCIIEDWKKRRIRI